METLFHERCMLTWSHLHYFARTILWRAGLETDSVLSGRLQVLRIRIGENGNMIIDFKTTTKFRGKWLRFN